METSEVTKKSSKNFKIKKKKKKKGKCVPLKKEFNMLTANYEAFCGVTLGEVGFMRHQSAFNLRNLIYVLQ